MTDPGWYVDPLDDSQYRYWDGTAWTEAVSPGPDATEAGTAATDAAGAAVPGPDAVTKTEPPVVGDDQVTKSISVDDLLGSDGGRRTELFTTPGFEPPKPFPGTDGVPEEGFGIPPEVAVEHYPTVPPPTHQSAPGLGAELSPGPEATGVGPGDGGLPYGREPDPVAQFPGSHQEPTLPGSGDPSWNPPQRTGPRSTVGEPTTRSRSRAPWLILGALTLLVIAVVAIIVVFGPQGGTSVDAIAEGQCFSDFGQFQATEVTSSVSTADCSEEHALEVFEVTSAPYQGFSDYPGAEETEKVAFRHCLSGFQQFVGIAYEESVLDVWALYPTQGSWTENGDREVVCMVGAFDQSLTIGTVRGSGR